MTITMSSSSSSTILTLPHTFQTPNTNTNTNTKPISLSFYKPRRTHLSISLSSSSSDNNTPSATATAVDESKKEEDVVVVVKDVSKTVTGTGNNSSSKFEKSEDSVGVSEVMEASVNATKFKDSRWVNGSWDLPKFFKDGATDWDSLIDAEARRRKWLQTYPESTTNAEPVLFDTSIIPWWAWMKRFHLPEAELLNGRAAMVGFFMSYFVDSLTGLGVVDQMGNFFCKTLLFVSVLGVLFIRKNEDVENLKKLFEETTFYDKQWQATWQEETKKD